MGLKCPRVATMLEGFRFLGFGFGLCSASGPLGLLRSATLGFWLAPGFGASGSHT